MAKSKNGIIGAIHEQKKSDVSIEPLSEKAKGFRPFATKRPPGSAANPQAVKASADHREKPSPTLQDGDSYLAYLDPDDIVSWKHKDRTTTEMEDDPEFHDLLKRISNAGGNIQPIKVRPIWANGGVQFEEVFGFKRLHACKRLGLQVLAIVESLTDKEAFSQQTAENSGRSPVSAWSRAISWNNALEKGLVSSLDDLAIETGKDVRTIQSYIRVFEIMDDELIENVKLHKLGIQPLFEIRSALLKFADKSTLKQSFIDRVIEKADAIEAGRGTPQMFVSISKEVSGEAKAAPSESTFTSDGSKMFSIKQGKQGYTLKMHFAATKQLPPHEIEKVIKDHLEAKGLKIDE